MNNEKNEKKLQEEKKALEDKVAELTALVQGFMSGQNNTSQENKFIKVTSYNPHLLILTTESKGRGTPYKFNKFGQSREIRSKDLEAILSIGQNLDKAKNFRFKFDDELLINAFGLKEVFENFPTMKEIKNILSCSKLRIKEIMDDAPQEFRRSLVEMAYYTYKEKDDGVLDFNKIKLLNDYFDEDLGKWFTRTPLEELDI